MKLNKLKENMEFHLQGVRHHVISIEPPKVYVIKGRGTQEEEYDYFEIINDPTFYSLDAVVKKRLKKIVKNTSPLLIH